MSQYRLIFILLIYPFHKVFMFTHVTTKRTFDVSIRFFVANFSVLTRLLSKQPRNACKSVHQCVSKTRFENFNRLLALVRTNAFKFLFKMYYHTLILCAIVLRVYKRVGNARYGRTQTRLKVRPRGNANKKHGNAF
jgi:hypothetical protein